MRPDQAFNPIRALESAWKILMKAPLPMWVGGLILVAVQSIAAIGGNPNLNLRMHHAWEPMIGLLIPMVMIGVFVGVAVSLAVSWLSVGYFNGVATVMRTGDVEFEKLFDARGRWISMFLTRLLQGFLLVLSMLPLGFGPLMGVIAHQALGLAEGLSVLVGIGGFLVCLPICFYVGLGLLLAPYSVALEGTNPFEAIARSWALASGNRLMLLVFSLVTILMVIAGLLMCCAGLLPAAIMIEVMWVEAYVQATQVDNYDDWWIRTVNRPRMSVPPTAAAEIPVESALEDGPAEERLPATDPEPLPSEGVGGQFDPGGWREQADIPPIDEDEEPTR